MAKGRVLLKAISTSQKLARLSNNRQRLLFSWLIPHLDVNGNFYGDERIIKSMVFPLVRYSLPTLRTDLAVLCANQLLTTYVIKGEKYVHVDGFTEKQPYLRREREFEHYPLNPKIPQDVGKKVDKVKVSKGKLNKEKLKAKEPLGLKKIKEIQDKYK